jgi:hypothetical protein
MPARNSLSIALLSLASFNSFAADPTPSDQAKKDAARFVARWRIIADDGKTACYFTLSSDSTAVKSHAPGVAGKWEVVGSEARITWGDGWKDVLRPDADGVGKVAFGPGVGWADPPTNTQRAVKELPADAASGQRHLPTVVSPAPAPTAGPSGPTLTGPRGGRYHIGPSGKKVYEKR